MRLVLSVRTSHWHIRARIREGNALTDSTQWRCFGPLTPSVPVKHRKIKIANTATKNRVTIRASLHARFNYTHCNSPDLAKHVLYYPRFVNFSFRTSMLARQSAAIGRAISFVRETSDPLMRKGRFL